MKQVFKKRVALLLAILMLSSVASSAFAQGITLEDFSDSGFSVNLEQSAEEKAALIASHTLADGRTSVSVAVEADPGTLTPYGSGVGKVQHVIRNTLFETAMVQDLQGNLEPFIATGFEKVDDTTYDVLIKDYVFDTAGNQLTAEDVAFSYLCGRDEWNNGNMSFIESAEAIDTYTVRIKMKSAQVGTFEKVMYEGWIFTKAAYEASPDQFITTPVGTSNYLLTKWTTGSEVVIEKSNNYWEKDDSNKQLIQQANVDVITYKIITEEAQRAIALQTGEVDMIHKVDFVNLGTFNPDDYTVFSTMNNQVFTMFFNCSDNSVCGDPLVRQAICYAIDSQGILDIVCSGQGEVAWATATNGSADAYDAWKERNYYGWDSEKAVALLEEAGYSTSNPLKIRIMYETTDKNAPTAEAMQAYLMMAGVEVEMYPCEGATYSTYKYGSAEFDIHVGSVGGLEPYCIGSWWTAVRGTGADDPGNVIALDDPKMTELIDACYSSATHDEAHMTEAFNYITDNAYMYSIYSYMLYTVTTNIFTEMNLRCGGREIAPQYCYYIWN